MRKPLTVLALLALVVGATLVTTSDAQARWRNRRGCCWDSCYSTCGNSCNSGRRSNVSNCCYTVVRSCCDGGTTATTSDQSTQAPKEAPPAPQATPSPWPPVQEATPANPPAPGGMSPPST
jgi:hypothetical protein